MEFCGAGYLLTAKARPIGQPCQGPCKETERSGGSSPRKYKDLDLADEFHLEHALRCRHNQRQENAMISLTVNGKRQDVDVSADMPLLWVIRDVVGLTGTKFGCGLSQCGACTAHLNGEPIRSCVT